MSREFKHSQWIWDKHCGEKNGYVQFIKDFKIKDEIETAKLLISADSNYAVWLNGIFVNFGQYGDFPFYKVYDELDIKNYLKKGINHLSILTHYIGEDTFVYVKAQAGLIFEMYVNEELITVSQMNDLCRIDTAYTNGAVEKITGQLGYTYHYNANNEDSWLEEAYIPNMTWNKSVLVDKTYELHKRPIKKLHILPPAKALICSQGIFFEDKEYACETVAVKMQNALLAYKTLDSLTGGYDSSLPSGDGIEFTAPYGDGVYVVIDLQREEAGVFNLSIDADYGTKIYIGYGEHLEDLRVRTSIGPRNFAASFVCKKGRNDFTGYFRRFGCRYIQLFVYAKNFKLFYAGIVPTNYPFEPVDLKVSDKLHQRIYDTSIRTLLLCAHEHYEDCPWREQALYSMDSRNQMLFGYYAFGEYQFARASLKLLALSIREDKLLSMCSPANIFNTIPSFNLTYFLQVYEYMLFSGDITLGEEVFEICKTVMSVFLNKISTLNGLVENFPEREFWNFYEWSEGLLGDNNPTEAEPITYDAPLNAMLSMALQAFSKICILLRKEDEAMDYYRCSQQINKAIDKCFWDETAEGYYSFISNDKRYHFSQLTQALVVCAGACEEEKIDRVLEKLFNESFVPITLSYSIFKYDALLKNRPQKYGKRVFDEVAQKWGGMLYRNATSFWETEKGDKDFDDAGSLCHGWSAVPIYLYFVYGLGVYPVKPAFEEYTVHSVETGIEYGDAGIKTPKGIIHLQTTEQVKK